MIRARSAARHAPVPAGEGGHAIDARDLTKRFRQRLILDRVTLRVPQGSAMILQGANGAGKTTLLRILATVVTPDAGGARVAGWDLRRNPARVRESIGVAFVNERSIFWRLNALENLMLFAATRGVAPARRRAQIDGLAEELGMEEFLERRISDLSTGQRQRIILARAGLGDPSVLLIDEPLRGLDEGGIEQAIGFITRRVERGSAALVATPAVGEFRHTGIPLARLVDGTVTAGTYAAAGIG